MKSYIMGGIFGIACGLVGINFVEQPLKFLILAAVFAVSMVIAKEQA